MNTTPDEEKSIKKSVSFPPSLWAFIEEYAGETGTCSKVVQKAVRMMQEASQKAKEEAEKSAKNGVTEMRKSRKNK